jgi:hypothetical protein
MHHRRGGLERQADDFVRGGPAQVRDETDPARIVLFDDDGSGSAIFRESSELRDGGKDLANG